MLKLLHTSDLHIGKRLYQADMQEDQLLFFRWLIDYIREHKVNVLLVSGDVFDVANPSSESRRIYFELLRELMVLQCKVFITGGNHDSPAMLEAPGELLKHLDIHVTGSISSEILEMVVPVENNEGQTELVVAAIPYLRDADLRQYRQDETYEGRLEAVRSGIAAIYEEAAMVCKQHYPATAAIAMGHLFVHGCTTSESEREIQIGNLAGMSSDGLPSYFAYYALGHLHKPQQSGERFVYSGAPVPLSFSESANRNSVVLITVDQCAVTHQRMEVPLNRRLERMTGSVEQLTVKLSTYTPGEGVLTDFIELIAKEEQHDPAKLLQLEDLIDHFYNEKATILKHRIQFAGGPLGTASLYDETQHIADMKPVDVFVRRLDREELEDHTRDKLLDAFRQILEEVEQQREELL